MVVREERDAKVGGVARRERRVRQRLQIMVVVYVCRGLACVVQDRPMDIGDWHGSSRFRLSQSGSWRFAEVR